MSSKDVKEYYKSNGADLLKVMFADVSVNTVFTSKVMKENHIFKQF